MITYFVAFDWLFVFSLVLSSFLESTRRTMSSVLRILGTGSRGWSSLFEGTSFRRSILYCVGPDTYTQTRNSCTQLTEAGACTCKLSCSDLHAAYVYYATVTKALSRYTICDLTLIPEGPLPHTKECRFIGTQF